MDRPSNDVMGASVKRNLDIIEQAITSADLAIATRATWTQETCLALLTARDEAQDFLDHRDPLKGMYEDIDVARRITEALRRFGETP